MPCRLGVREGSRLASRIGELYHNCPPGISRLSVILEGESLFNDGTSIVLSRIVLGIIVANALDNALQSLSMCRRLIQLYKSVVRQRNLDGSISDEPMRQFLAELDE